MKKTFLLSLVLAAFAVGCGSSNSLRSGFVTLTWSLEDRDTGDPVSCAAGDKVLVTSVPISGGSKTYIDRFDCSLLGGTTSSIGGGDYSVTVQLVDSAGAAVTQPSPAMTVHVDGLTYDIGHFILQV